MRANKGGLVYIISDKKESYFANLYLATVYD